MEEVKEKKAHPVFGIPYLGMFLLLLIDEGVLQLVSGVLNEVIPDYVLLFLLAAIGLGEMILHHVYFRKEYKGSLATSCLKDVKLWIIVGIGFVLCCASDVYDIIRTGFNPINVRSIAICFSAAFAEEAVFRDIMISIQMRSDKDKNTFLPALLISAFIFGVMHFMNLASGATISITLLQVLACFGMGILWGALFLRTGNIAYTIIWHFLHDFLASMALMGAGGVYTSEATTIDIVETIIVTILMCAVGFFLLFKQKKQVIEVWQDRWYGVTPSLPKNEPATADTTKQN